MLLKKRWIIKKLIFVFKNEKRIILISNYIGGNLVTDKKKLVKIYGLDSFFVKGSLLTKFFKLYYKGVLDKALAGNLFFVFIKQEEYSLIENTLQKDKSLIPLFLIKDGYCFNFYSSEFGKNFFLMTNFNLQQLTISNFLRINKTSLLVISMIRSLLREYLNKSNDGIDK